MADTIYCYPDTDVLINKMNIRNEKDLGVAESSIAAISEAKMRGNPVKGNFDLKHLQVIHRELFGSVYDWAGELRRINIRKGNTPFCDCMHIQTYGQVIFDNISKDGFLIGLDKKTAISKLAEYIGEINALHPFRDGNGRSQRQFIEHLAKATGIQLHFSKAYNEDMYLAAVDSFNGVLTRYENILNEISEPMTRTEQREFLNAVSDIGVNIFDRLQVANELPDRETEFAVEGNVKKPKTKPRSRGMTI